MKSQEKAADVCQVPSVASKENSKYAMVMKINILIKH